MVWLDHDPDLGYRVFLEATIPEATFDELLGQAAVLTMADKGHYTTCQAVDASSEFAYVNVPGVEFEASALTSFAGESDCEPPPKEYAFWTQVLEGESAAEVRDFLRAHLDDKARAWGTSMKSACVSRDGQFHRVFYDDMLPRGRGVPVLKDDDEREDRMQSRFGIFATAALAACALFGRQSRVEACLPEPIPKSMEFVASYPDEEGILAADRDVVLVFSTGSLYDEGSVFPLTFPPQGFAVWEDSGASPTPVTVEVVEKTPQESKWDGIGLPIEIREWSSSAGGKKVIRMYRLKAEAGWTVGTTYRVDFQYGDVSGMQEPPFPEEPVWIPQSVHFTAGAPAGSLTVPTGELQVDFEKEYAKCWEYCVDDCAMSCQGLAMAVQQFHISSYGLAVDDSTGPLVIRFYSSGSDLQDTGMHASRSYIVLPGDTQGPLDLVYLRRGPILWDGCAAGDGCEVCLAITVEAPEGTILDAPAQQCLQAYQAPKPDEPCDPDDWGEEEGGNEPPTLLHWPVCKTEIVEETGGVDVVQPDAGWLPEGQPDVQAGPMPTEAQADGDSATAEDAAPAGSGGRGCSSGAATPADSVWLSIALLLVQLIVVQALLARRRRVPVPATGCGGQVPEER